MADVVNAFKQSSGTPFSRGPMTEEEWLYYAATHVRQNEKGMWVRSFDPGILKLFIDEPLGQVDLWALWGKITQPVLTLHGGLSVLLTKDICARMTARKQGTKMDLVTLPDCGHVPSLYPASQIKLIEDWLAT
jgi:pimeloyl-ACP methyl ester carboxylesterase